MARKLQAPGTNSATKMISLMKDGDIVPIPKNVMLSDEEAELWPQFTCTRVKEDWNEFDLILLAKMVKLEYQIRLNWDQHLLEGVVTENAKGTPVANPRLAVIESYTRQQMGIIRSLSMTTKGDSRTIANKASKLNGYKGAVDDDDLLAK